MYAMAWKAFAAAADWGLRLFLNENRNVNG